MFDYRSANLSWGNSKNAIERSVAFLTGDKLVMEEIPDTDEDGAASE